MSYGAIILFGLVLFKNKLTLVHLGLGAIGAGVLFFIISNFGVWMNGLMYSKDLSGLLNCYIAGIPFFKGTIMGNFFYIPVIFGTYSIMQKRFPILRSTETVFSLY